MMADKKLFSIGTGLMVAFLIVLVIIFMPIFNGQNGLDTLDALFNSISKGSAFKNIESLRPALLPFEGKQIEVELEVPDQEQARQIALLFQKSAAQVTVTGAGLKIAADLGRILQNALQDAELMYANDSQTVYGRYGIEGRRVLFNWWTSAAELEKVLKKQKNFKEAKIVAELKKKAIEMAFNYYGIEPQLISDRWATVVFSLVFYVIYTLWYGFAVMYMFEGWGMQLEH